MGGTSFDVTQVGHLTLAVAHAVIWQNGNPADLSTLVTGGANLELHAVRRLNERGQILGEGRDGAIPALRAFVLQNGTVTDLGALFPTGSTEPFDMNDLGHVVGCSDVTLGVEHAFVWKNGSMTDLHDPSVILGRCSTARAINESGVIVGSADFVNNGIQLETATVWDHGTIVNLGTLAGAQSYARDINDHGTIVGTTTFQGNGVHAFIYRGGVMQDLNDLVPGSGWTLANAHDITNDGRIVGEGFNNGLRPFLLEPDGCGGFAVYGAGCPGAGGYTPALWGAGCATSEGQVSFAVTAGAGGAGGALLFGSGPGTVAVLPGCDLQILPLFAATLPLRLSGVGAGEGTWQTEFALPANTPQVSLFLQFASVDASGLSLSNALRMDTL